MAQQVISNYSAHIFGVGVKTDKERSKDTYDPCAFKFHTFSFRFQISHIRDYLWGWKFSVEGFNKNKKVDFRRKYKHYKF